MPKQPQPQPQSQPQSQSLRWGGTLITLPRALLANPGPLRDDKKLTQWECRPSSEELVPGPVDLW